MYSWVPASISIQHLPSSQWARSRTQLPALVSCGVLGHTGLGLETEKLKLNNKNLGDGARTQIVEAENQRGWEQGTEQSNLVRVQDTYKGDTRKIHSLVWQHTGQDVVSLDYTASASAEVLRFLETVWMLVGRGNVAKPSWGLLRKSSGQSISVLLWSPHSKIGGN